MKFMLDGLQYRLRFIHENNERELQYLSDLDDPRERRRELKHLRKEGLNRAVTTAMVEVDNPVLTGPGNRWTSLAKGVASTSWLDNFNKTIGRGIALHRLVLELDKNGQTAIAKAAVVAYNQRKG